MSRIIVKNLPTSGVNEAELRKHFSDIDTVTDIKLKYSDAGNFRRFAFVGFRSEDAAHKAIDLLNNSFIKTSKISLEPCKAIKEIKPDKVGRKDLQVEQRDIDETNGTEPPSNNKNQSKRKRCQKDDVFEEVRDEPEFKDFLNLQRNLGDSSRARQIWADDANLEVENANVQSTELASDAITAHDTAEPNGEKLTKRHHRSRPKKKTAKVKPKELFVHTAKIAGFPKEAKRRDIKDFFKPLELLSIRLNKRDEICYVSFKDDSDLKFALRKNLQFWNAHRIKLWKHDVKRSRVFKEKVREGVKLKEESIKKYETSMVGVEPVEESGRLFVRNLNYTCTQDDLEELFTKYGSLTEIHFPIDKTTSMPKGFAYVEFMFPKDAAKAYEELNGIIFQGRNFHLIPSKPKPEPRPIFNSGLPKISGVQETKPSTFKREKLAKQKEQAPRASNWNILFLGQNALADVVSDMKNMDKSKLLTKQTHKDPIAVRMALGDATVVEGMRKFLVSNGIELDSFDNPKTPRSRAVILVKNLPASTRKDELEGLFGAHGRVARVILPPNGLTAIVEMEEPVEAKLAFKKLAYSKFKDTILYLEWAPVNVFREKAIEDQEQEDLKELEKLQTGTKILVKNIPFEATQHELKKIFASYGELNFVRIPKKMDGQHRGFGFIDYLTREDALRAFRSLCHSTHLYGRKLVLEWAKSDDATIDNPA